MALQGHDKYHRCQHRLKMCSPLRTMMKSPFERKILDWDVKQQINSFIFTVSFFVIKNKYAYSWIKRFILVS